MNVGGSRPQSRLRLVVGIHDGMVHGGSKYAEQLALTGARGGHEVILLTTTASVADVVRERLTGSSVRVLDLGMRDPSPSARLLHRLWPGLYYRGLERPLRRTLSAMDPQMIVHLTGGGPAWVVGGLADRVCTTAWFYPHDPRARLRETWRHTKGGVLRRVVITFKSIAHYRSDEHGFRHSDVVVAPTEQLAAQLRSQGLNAVACTPPLDFDDDGAGPERADATWSESSSSTRTRSAAGGVVRLLTCCGDLSHPRKNVAAALHAAGALADRGWQVHFELIGGNPEGMGKEAARLPAGLEVSFTGLLRPMEILARMRTSDVFVFPSLFEEWGYVVPEALACGTPVATFPVYPFPSMVANDLGVVARDMSPTALADAVEAALVCPPREQIAHRASELFGSRAIERRLTEIWSGWVQPVTAAP